MKVPELLNRLAHDLKTDSAGNLSLSDMQRIGGEINAVLQLMHDIAPVASKRVKTVLAIKAPKTISLSVTSGSVDFTGWTPDADDRYCSVLIDGDDILNEITGQTVLLLPYAGTTGTHTATLWHDSIEIPATYQEIIFPLVDVSDNDTWLSQGPVVTDKQTGEPEWAWVADNASAHNPDAPMVLSVNTLPGSLYRYQFEAILSPPRVTLADMTDSTAQVPLRYEHIESRLIPAVRGRLATTDMWRSDATRAATSKAGDEAISSYRLVPQYQSTPDNRVGTPYGF